MIVFSVRDHNACSSFGDAPFIDNSDMVEHEDWCINAYEVCNAARLLCLHNSDRRDQQ